MSILTILKQQPRGLYTLSFVEMFERFAFFGIKSLVILYMTQSLLLGDKEAFCLYSAFMALSYASSILGAVISDQILGKLRSIVLGCTMMCIGYGLLIFDSQSLFYVALCFIAMGSGFFKPNIMAFLSSLYANDIPYRDAGFTLFYVAINVGGFIAPLLCGYVGLRYGWTNAFTLTFIIMGLALVLMLKKFNFDLTMPQRMEKPFIRYGTYFVILVSLLLGYLILKNCSCMNYIMSAIAIGATLYFVFLLFNSPADERKSLISIAVLMSFCIVFFALLEQIGSSLTLFAERNVDRSIFGFSLSAGQLQSFDSIFIILLGPLFAQAWIYLSHKNLEPYAPMKFVIGLFLAGCCFITPIIGIQLTQSHTINLGWFILTYFFHTSAELCVAPIGISMVTKLAPKRIVSMTISLWFLMLSFGQYVSGLIAQLASIPHSLKKSDSPQTFLPIYEQAFFKMALIAFTIGILLFFISFKLKPVFQRIQSQDS